MNVSLLVPGRSLKPQTSTDSTVTVQYSTIRCSSIGHLNYPSHFLRRATSTAIHSPKYSSSLLFVWYSTLREVVGACRWRHCLRQSAHLMHNCRTLLIAVLLYSRSLPLLARKSSADIAPVLSTCPLHTNSGRGKRVAHINWSMVTCQDSTRSELP